MMSKSKARYAVVSHRYWGSPGGGQLVDAAAAIALSEAGFNPILTGTFSFDPRKYVDWYGIDLSSFKIITLSIGIKAFGLLTRLYAWKPAETAIKRYNTDLLFTDEPTYKPLLKYRYHKSLKIIEYIHFPLEIVVNPKFKGTGLAYGEDPYIMERYGRFPLNMYWKLFTTMLPHYIRSNPFEDSDAVLTNSRWTAKVIKEVYGGDPIVLNPPIAPNTEIIGKPPEFDERGPKVVMLGRFSEEKRYHWVVKEVAPRLFKEMPNAELIIMGGATTRTQINYLDRVEAEARKVGLRVIRGTDAAKKDGGIVRLIPNAPRSMINSIMDSSRAFLHATINEHWGIAVAEAMSRGLPIVVHASGGTWTDLAGEGENGIGYRDPEGAVEALAKLLTNEPTFSKFSISALSRVKGLTLKEYSDKLGKIVRELL